MALTSILRAVRGPEGMTTFRPGDWTYRASSLSLWCSNARMPPPMGARMTIGTE